MLHRLICHEVVTSKLFFFRYFCESGRIFVYFWSVMIPEIQHVWNATSRKVPSKYRMNDEEMERQIPIYFRFANYSTKTDTRAEGIPIPSKVRKHANFLGVHLRLVRISLCNELTPDTVIGECTGDQHSLYRAVFEWVIIELFEHMMVWVKQKEPTSCHQIMFLIIIPDTRCFLAKWYICISYSYCIYS